MERKGIIMLVVSNLQAEMARQGTNAAELARMADLNPTGVYDIISGKSRNPRLDTIEKLAGALGVSPASLLQEKDEDDLRRQVMDAIIRLPADECRRLLLTAKAWAAAHQPQ